MNRFIHGGALAACWLMLAVSGWAQERDDEAALELDPVTVVAHRQPRALSEVAGTVTVIGAERMERDVVIDIADLVRYEPGVEVDGGGTRFGSGGFRIRGIGGNRTAVVIDNVPAADRFTIGNFADSGRGLMELGLVSRVEILRGPASTIYGSKALGGVVAVSLLDTDDLLIGSDRGYRLGLAGGTDRDRARLVGAAAAREGDWDWLAAGAVQTGSEVAVARRSEGQPRDPQDSDQGAALLRLGRETAGGGRVRMTFDGIREDRETDIRAILGSGRFGNTTSLVGDDRRNQWRLLLDHHFEPGHLIGRGHWISRGHWRVWRQSTDTRQESFEERLAAPVPVDLYRRFDFRQETTGAGADLESEFEFMGLSHRLGYGFEAVRSDLVQQRFATQTTLATGQTTTTVLGEQFPLRDFPRTRVNELGIYIHDEIRLWRGGPMISPGIRFEYYELDSRSDPLFADAFPDADIVDLDTTAWMPRLGLLWPLTGNLDLFAQYARGFRSPPFEDVNIGLDIPQFGIIAIPNPDLDPERGRTLEAGLRWRSPGTVIDLAVFRNRFEDFIETRAAIGFDPALGALVFQSVNRDRVRIEGFELRARQRLAAGFSLELAAEWLRGEDRSDGRSLAQVSPPQAIVSLEYAPRADWDLRLVTTATRAQRRLEDAAGAPLFSAPGHVLTDLIGRWHPRHDLSLSLGLFNLADRQAWNNASVSGRPPNDPVLPLLAEPGRHVRGNVVWSF